MIRIMDEREPLRRGLNDKRKDFRRLIRNFNKVFEQDPKGEELERLVKENQIIITSINEVLLNKEIIRTEEIDRMRIFAGGLKTTNNILGFKKFEGKEIVVKDNNFPSPPLNEVYSNERFKNYVESAERSWDKIRKDYKLKN